MKKNYTHVLDGPPKPYINSQMMCNLRESRMSALLNHNKYVFKSAHLFLLSLAAPPTTTHQKAQVSYGFGVMMDQNKSNFLVTMLPVMDDTMANYLNMSYTYALFLQFLVHCVFFKEVLKHVSFR